MEHASKIFIEKVVMTYMGAVDCPHCLRYNDFVIDGEYSTWKCYSCNRNFIIDINSSNYVLSNKRGSTGEVLS